MTPQQAIADQATNEVMQHFVANISGMELREKIKQTIIKAMEFRAPTPTEPAVDRDAVLEEVASFFEQREFDQKKIAFVVSEIRALKLATPASPAVPEPAPLAPSYGPVHVVADLVSNLLTLDQALPIYSAFHVDYEGKRRCRTRAVSISKERVVDGKWVESSRKDVPYSIVVWAKPAEDLAPQVAQASQWFSMADVLPPLGTDVLVRCDSWQRPMVLQYAEVPFQKLNDYANGKWYWAPESMQWMPIPASQPTSDPKGAIDVEDLIRELGVEDEVARIRAEQFSQPTSAEGKDTDKEATK